MTNDIVSNFQYFKKMKDLQMKKRKHRLKSSSYKDGETVKPNIENETTVTLNTGNLNLGNQIEISIQVTSPPPHDKMGISIFHLSPLERLMPDSPLLILTTPQSLESFESFMSTSTASMSVKNSNGTYGSRAVSPYRATDANDLFCTQQVNGLIQNIESNAAMIPLRLSFQEKYDLDQTNETQYSDNSLIENPLDQTDFICTEFNGLTKTVESNVNTATSEHVKYLTRSIMPLYPSFQDKYGFDLKFENQGNDISFLDSSDLDQTRESIMSNAKENNCKMRFLKFFVDEITGACEEVKQSINEALYVGENTREVIHSTPNKMN